MTLILLGRHGENPRKFSSGSSLLAMKPNVSSLAVEVRVIDLSNFLAQFDCVDFLKIDVEGYEVELIPHLLGNLNWDLVRFVAVETHEGAKWTAMSNPTHHVKSLVRDAGLDHKFSWSWP